MNAIFIIKKYDSVATPIALFPRLGDVCSVNAYQFHFFLSFRTQRAVFVSKAHARSCEIKIPGPPVERFRKSLKKIQEPARKRCRSVSNGESKCLCDTWH